MTPGRSSQRHRRTEQESPAARRNSPSAGPPAGETVSTPSAVVSMPRLEPSPMMARMMATNYGAAADLADERAVDLEPAERELPEIAQSWNSRCRNRRGRCGPRASRQPFEGPEVPAVSSGRTDLGDLDLEAVRRRIRQCEQASDHVSTSSPSRNWAAEKFTASAAPSGQWTASCRPRAAPALPIAPIIPIPRRSE